MARGRGAAVVAGSVLAVLVVFAAVLGPPTVRTPDWMTGDGTVEPRPTPQHTIPEEPDTSDQTPLLDPDDVDAPFDVPVPWPILAFLVLALLAVVAFRLKDRLRTVMRRFGGSSVVGVETDEEPEPEFRDAARRARQVLLRGGKPGHDAVIQAWVTLEASAEQSGTTRRPSETPTEFTARLLARQHADRDATDQLLHIYHRARFSTHPHVSDDEVASAVAALDTIVESLSVDRSEHA